MWQAVQNNGCVAVENSLARFHPPIKKWVKNGCVTSASKPSKNEMSQLFFLLIVVCGMTQDAVQIKKLMIELIYSSEIIH